MNSGSMGSNIIEWAGRLWILAAIPAAKNNASTSITEMLSLITLKIIIWRRCAQFGFKLLRILNDTIRAMLLVKDVRLGEFGAVGPSVEHRLEYGASEFHWGFHVLRMQLTTFGESCCANQKRVYVDANGVFPIGGEYRREGRHENGNLCPEEPSLSENIEGT